MASLCLANSNHWSKPGGGWRPLFSRYAFAADFRSNVSLVIKVWNSFLARCSSVSIGWCGFDLGFPPCDWVDEDLPVPRRISLTEVGTKDIGAPSNANIHDVRETKQATTIRRRRR